ncbi:MAG TPA: serine hydroxymethyltransferase [Blastococcus sp.]|nr:serine hydroxymethyltransferase [Blastococcus sp.]
MSTPYWGPDFDALAAFDPDIAGVVTDELDRLRGGLQLIASENFTSPAVLAALGSTLSNKYAEGYPGRRYYGGCEVVDRAEEIGIARAKELFGAEHANLQPHSGANANLAAYGAFLEPGDTFLAMALPHGGHLTHGAKVSFSGKWFNAVQYGVDRETEHIDYDQVRDLAREHRPKMIICGGSAIPRLIDFAAFREICDEVGAIMMVDAAHFIGLVAGKAIPSPVPYADVVTFTTHKVLRGPRGGAFVCKAEHASALDKAAFPMMQGGPLMHAVAAKAVNLKECLQPEYQAYARQVIANAQALTEGLAAEGLRPVAGGTDTHLALLDLRETGVTGRDAEARSGAAGIVLNKNAIPFDPQPAQTASGIRVGSPAVTTQGMVETDMKEIASLIGTAIRDADGSRTAEVAAGVRELVGAHPAYREPARTD